MRNINRIIVEGNATRDAEIKQTNTGKVLAEFAIAVNRDDQVSYFDVNAWEKLGEICQSMIKKGTHVIIDGRLVQSRWESEGKTKSHVSIVADNVRILSKKQTPGEDY